MTGRPSSYTDEKADQICERISEGETIRQICADQNMPAAQTLYRWMEQNERFRERYTRARETQLERWEDELIEIADDASNDWLKREQESGRIDEVPDHEHINRSRLRVDARKWIMSKRLPKKYGDRVDVAGDIAVSVTVRRFDEIAAENTGPLIEHQAFSPAKPLETLAPVRIIDAERTESAVQQSDKPDRSTEE